MSMLIEQISILCDTHLLIQRSPDSVHLNQPLVACDTVRGTVKKTRRHIFICLPHMTHHL